MNAVEHVTGDLFTYPGLDAIGHGVNCQGVMGAGIARAFRALDENMYRQYRDLCSRSVLRVGDMHPWRLADGRWVYNLASQFRTGRDARLSAIETALDRALEHATDHQLTSLGLPRIGCGIGGLTWAEVSAVIETVAARHPVRVVTVTPA